MIKEAQQSTSIQVRCPDCFKLYAINSSDIHEAQPHFVCAHCSTQFWLPYPECLESASGLIGFKVEIEESGEKLTAPKELNLKPFSCPKCGEAYHSGQTECEKCGVVFHKFVSTQFVASQRRFTDLSASQELKDLWESALLEYENASRHQVFVNYAFADGNVDYAIRKYTDILDSNPSDEIANQRIKEIQARTVAHAQSQRKAPAQAKWHDITIPRLRLSPLFFVIAGGLICTGLIVPGSRNLVGFGCSLLFVTFAVKFYFNQPKKV